ncbi:MAG: hypothetical protein LAP87_31205 [Acidobacteriia bacterium]|nr:hypothetical protein [Terriglobia bacterium]
MRDIQICSTLILSLFLPLAAQTYDPAASLRQHLGVDNSWQITPAADKSLPGGPIKVFLAVGPDASVEQHFSKWIQNWNKKDGKKYGTVSLVSRLDQADVVLARYVHAEQAVPRTVEESKTLSGPPPQGDYSGAQRIALLREVPFAPASLWVLHRVERRLDSVTEETSWEPLRVSGDTGQNLWSEFAELMKQRAQAAR